MKRNSAKPKKVSVNKYESQKQKPKPNLRQGQFPLNPNGSDRITFVAELDTSEKVKVVRIVSYEILINGIWERVIRYDDHAGSGFLHRHERIRLENLSEFPIPIYDGVKRKGTKQKLLEWAIQDIIKNYLIYRKRVLKRSNVDLY